MIVIGLFFGSTN